MGLPSDNLCRYSVYLVFTGIGKFHDKVLVISYWSIVVVILCGNLFCIGQMLIEVEEFRSSKISVFSILTEQNRFLKRNSGD